MFQDKLQAQWITPLVWAPYILVVIGAALALQFAKRQLLLSVLLTLINYLLIRHYLQAPIDQPLVRYVYTLLVIGLPLIMLLNQGLTERGLSHTNATALYGLAIIVFGLSTSFYILNAAYWVNLLDSYFAPRSYDLFVISSNGLICSLLILTLSLALYLWQRTSIQAGLFFVMLANLVPLYCLDVPYISSIFCTAAILIALATGIKTSHDLAYRDPLTGLNGRRKLFERLAGLSRPYALAMLDIDHFKKFNDTYGHDVGDDVLAMVASKIAEVRGGGEVFRYGGEEFTLIFSALNKQDAKAYLDEVRELIASTPFVVRDRSKRKTSSAQRRSNSKQAHKKVQITVSIGVAEYGAEQTKAEQIIKAADKALYRAKEQGRNCVIVG
ncbi:GGDEF domain-containing protein [Shewanella sp. C32]|uniref:diguanylate cyclase n=1 Tax=Shewanella electrica TaxID=515560 RepID=A0ABT2FK69_9GAMM|nr:GGDEF domain-containing protein [Shewanella electrica]MCH1924832.1 GGDEF domain-containing protein [Shewanella electrica]MCS4556721.1 GGDEF domain-containing protein [Shewanella electrica]